MIRCFWYNTGPGLLERWNRSWGFNSTGHLSARFPIDHLQTIAFVLQRRLRLFGYWSCVTRCWAPWSRSHAEIEDIWSPKINSCEWKKHRWTTCRYVCAFQFFWHTFSDVFVRFLNVCRSQCPAIDSKGNACVGQPKMKEKAKVHYSRLNMLKFMQNTDSYHTIDKFRLRSELLHRL